MSELLALPFSQFGQTHQSIILTPNTSGRVFYYPVPARCKGFIRAMASNYFSDTYYVFMIDGAVVEKFDRQMGRMDDPRKIDPPFLVKDKIEVTVFNNSSETLTFEVFIDGNLYEEEFLEG